MSKDVDRLAAEIRKVDGAHSLGAAELAKALMPLVVQMKAEAWDEGWMCGNGIASVMRDGLYRRENPYLKETATRK